MLRIGVESAGGGLIGDVNDYIRFADALANDGVGFNGYKLLSRASIDEMRTDQLTDESRPEFVKFSGSPEYGYGLGVRTLIDNSRSRSPIGEFGWNGAAGAWAMIDVDHHLSAFYAQHIMECGYCYAVIHPTIRDLIYECMEA
jgi:CubicO group peptidase (beta-lactamase class C family)